MAVSQGSTFKTVGEIKQRLQSLSDDTQVLGGVAINQSGDSISFDTVSQDASSGASSIGQEQASGAFSGQQQHGAQSMDQQQSGGDLSQGDPSMERNSSLYSPS